MKKTFLMILTAVLFLSTQAQDAFTVQMDVYKTALKYYDLPTAITSLYTAMAIKPERKDLKDSLTLVYFASERFPQANALAEEILKDNPKRFDMLEVAAISKQSLGAVKEALADYENLYKDQKNVYNLYQIATLQYQLKRFGESIASLDQITKDAESDKKAVNIKSQNGQGQNVPIKAAAYNVRGIIALELNQEEAAKQNFESALQAYPDFALAKGNLAMIEKKKANATAPKSTPAKPASTTTPVRPAGK